VGVNPGLHSEKLETNCLSYGTPIFGLKRDEVTGGYRNVHNEGYLHNLHFSTLR
jgi:hypothetical protein